jgi:hypothetical protein
MQAAAAEHEGIDGLRIAATHPPHHDLADSVEDAAGAVVASLQPDAADGRICALLGKLRAGARRGPSLSVSSLNPKPCAWN